MTFLLSDVNWDESTLYGQELGELRVHQLNKELSITSELIDQVIILASGGYNTGASGGGGGSDNNDPGSVDISRGLQVHLSSLFSYPE